jgi:hypothetical protein
VCVRLTTALLSNLGHPYKACREEIARTLGLVYGLGRLPLVANGVDVLAHVRGVVLAEAAPDPEVQVGRVVWSVGGGAGWGGLGVGLCAIQEEEGGGRSQIQRTCAWMSAPGSYPLPHPTSTPTQGLAAATAQQLSVGEGGAQPDTPTSGTTSTASASQEDLTRRRETVLRWVLGTANSGDLWCTLPLTLPLLPAVFEAVRDRDEETRALAKAAAGQLVRLLWLRTRRERPELAAALVAEAENGGDGSGGEGGPEGADDMACLLATLLRLARQPSWYVRLEVAQALAVVAAQQRPLLTAREQVGGCGWKGGE